MATNEELAKRLTEHGIRPTGNRIVILRALDETAGPVSLRGLGDVTETIDKSGLSRALTLFRRAGMLHAIEGEGGVMLYELCRGEHEDGRDSDGHVHFYCTRCRRTICLHGAPLPEVRLPAGYAFEAVNCVVKGVCADCARGRNASRGGRPS